MNPVSSIALSGMAAAQTRLDSAAHNIANVQTEPFRRQQVVQESVAEGGTRTGLRRAGVPGEALAQDMVDQMSAGYSFVANLKVIQTEKQMLGALLNEKA